VAWIIPRVDVVNCLKGGEGIPVSSLAQRQAIERGRVLPHDPSRFVFRNTLKSRSTTSRECGQVDTVWG
jgi:hypothetical protein